MKERLILIIQICERAERIGYKGNRQTLLMDIESADHTFHLRLDDWLNADDLNFAHDIYGITQNIVRNKYPATNFGYFVPRFAGQNQQ